MSGTGSADYTGAFLPYRHRHRPSILASYKIAVSKCECNTSPSLSLRCLCIDVRCYIRPFYDDIAMALFRASSANNADKSSTSCFGINGITPLLQNSLLQ